MGAENVRIITEFGIFITTSPWRSLFDPVDNAVMDTYDVLFISFLFLVVYLSFKFKVGVFVQRLFPGGNETSTTQYLNAYDPYTDSVSPTTSEVEKELGWGEYYKLKVPIKEMNEYENARDNCPDPDLVRQILFRKAVALIPIFRRIETDYPDFEGCKKRGIIQEKHWLEIKAAREWMNEEFMDLKQEAERLLPGSGDYIIPQAVRASDEMMKNRRKQEIQKDVEAARAAQEVEDRKLRKQKRAKEKHNMEIKRQQKLKKENEEAKKQSKLIEELLQEEEAERLKASKTNQSPVKNRKKKPKKKSGTGFKKGFLN